MVAYGVSIALAAILLGTVPCDTRDIYNYIARGRLWQHYGVNPLTSDALGYGTDPLIALDGWLGSPSPYGPFWAMIAFAISSIGQGSLLLNILAFKAVVIGSFIAALPLLRALADRVRPGSGTAAIVAFGWNPLVIVDVLCNAHNDMVPLSLGLAACLLAARDRWSLAWPILVLSALTKLSALPLLVVFFVWNLRRGVAAWRGLVVGLLGGLGAALACYWPFWEGHVLALLPVSRAKLLSNSPVAALSVLLPQASHGIQTASLVVCGIGTAALLLRTDTDPKAALGTLLRILILGLVSAAWFYWPWYALWPLAMASAVLADSLAGPTLAFAACGVFAQFAYDWRDLLGLQWGTFRYDATFVALAFFPGLAIFLSRAVVRAARREVAPASPSP